MCLNETVAFSGYVPKLHLKAEQLQFTKNHSNSLVNVVQGVADFRNNFHVDAGHHLDYGSVPVPVVDLRVHYVGELFKIKPLC